MKIRRILSGIFALILTVSLCACGDTEESSTPEKTSETTVATTSVTTTAPTAETTTTITTTETENNSEEKETTVSEDSSHGNKVEIPMNNEFKYGDNFEGTTWFDVFGMHEYKFDNEVCSLTKYKYNRLTNSISIKDTLLLPYEITEDKIILGEPGASLDYYYIISNGFLIMRYEVPFTSDEEINPYELGNTINNDTGLTNQNLVYVLQRNDVNNYLNYLNGNWISEDNTIEISIDISNMSLLYKDISEDQEIIYDLYESDITDTVVIGRTYETGNYAYDIMFSHFINADTLRFGYNNWDSSTFTRQN